MATAAQHYRAPISRRRVRAKPGVRRRTPGARAPAGRVSIQWDRLGRIALVIAIGVVIASYVQPLSNYITQLGAAKNDRVQLEALRGENQDLGRRIAEQRDPRTLEAEARRLGMVRQGERPYIVEGLGTGR